MAGFHKTPGSYETVPIDSLTPHPRNPRLGDTDAVKETLRVHGQWRPLVVQKSTRFILAGNHAYAAMQALGWSEVAIHLVDVDDAAAMRILLADNHTGDLAEYDEKQLAMLLQDVGHEDTGYSQDEYEAIISGVDVPESQKVIAPSKQSKPLAVVIGRDIRVTFTPEEWAQVVARHGGDQGADDDVVAQNIMRRLGFEV